MSGYILDHAHWFGLSSWRWLFVLEGLPAIVCGPLTYFFLPNVPAAAPAQPGTVIQTLTSPRVWHLAAIGFGHGFATYTFSFWLPQIMKSLLGAASNTAIGFAVMIPNAVGLIAMVLVSRHSDRTVERRWHMALPGAVAGIAMLLLGVPRSPFWSIVLFSVVAAGAYSFLPVFFSVPGEFLAGISAATGIALITSVSNLGGFVGPYTMGIVRNLAWAGAFYLISATLAAYLSPRQLGQRA